MNSFVACDEVVMNVEFFLLAVFIRHLETNFRKIQFLMARKFGYVRLIQCQIHKFSKFYQLSNLKSLYTKKEICAVLFCCLLIKTIFEYDF